MSNQGAAKRGAVQHQVGFSDRRRNWLAHHRQESRASLRRLLRSPLTTLMTLAVLAIALALPGFMFTALANVQQLSAGWDGEQRMSLYLSTELDDQQVERFSQQLLLRDDLLAVELTDREQGLWEFRQYSGLADLIDALGENPLPAVITVLPRATEAAQLGLLQTQFEAMQQVDKVVFDLAWLQRLTAMVTVAERLAWVLGLLLISAVLLVVGNTVRMTVESRRDEIVVAKLVGATDAWVRRPFLYAGVWYGLFGALLAWLLIQLALLMLQQPVQQLGALYNSAPLLEGPGFMGSLMLLAIGLTLGWLGAFMSVSSQLRKLEALS